MKDLKALLEKHKAFWMMEKADRPLMSLRRYKPLRKGKGITLADGRITADGDYITPEMVKPCLFNYAPRSPKVVNGDFISTVAPPDFCWMEAILGCLIRMYGGVPWSEPLLKIWDDLNTAEFDLGNKWLDKLLEFTRFLVEEFTVKSGIPVSQPLFRGPIDMAVAALGPTNFCISIYRNPDKLRRLLQRCTDINIKVTKMRLELTPEFHGGHVCWGIWWPGEWMRTQADHAALLSPKTFGKHVLPYYRRLIQAFNCSTAHLHSLGSLHIVNDLLTEKRLKAVQVSLDFVGGKTEVLPLLPTLAKIKERKPLILSGPITEKELEVVYRNLSPNGLCLQLELLP